MSNPLRIATIVGTRPCTIRMSRIITLLDAVAARHDIIHTFIHTAQNKGAALKDQFYSDLNLRHEDVTMPITSWYEASDNTLRAHVPSPGPQWIGSCVQWLSENWGNWAPDRVLILGDTNTAVAAAYVAKRAGALLYHVEAGNRCFDPRSPEELNRRIVDHLSDVHMCYTSQARRNLAHEGITRNVHVVGNPLLELARSKAKNYGRAMADLRPELDGKIIDFPYYLCSLHRAENVDALERRSAFWDAVCKLADDAAVIVSVHPRLKEKLALDEVPTETKHRIWAIEPTNFSQWVKLERCALCVLSDSGGEPEECAALGVPSVMLRDSTERVELIEHGCAVLASCDDSTHIVQLARMMSERCIVAPPDYARTHVAEAIANIVLAQAPLRSGLE